MDWADYLRDQAAKYRQLAETAEGLSVNGDDRRAPFASALVNSTQFKRWATHPWAARGGRLADVGAETVQVLGGHGRNPRGTLCARRSVRNL